MQSGCFNHQKLVFNHPMQHHTTFNSTFYNEMQHALYQTQTILQDNDIIFLQNNATPHHQQYVESLLHAWGWEMLAYQTYPHVIIFSLLRRSSHFRNSSLNLHTSSMTLPHYYPLQTQMITLL